MELPRPSGKGGSRFVPGFAGAFVADSQPGQLLVKVEFGPGLILSRFHESVGRVRVGPLQYRKAGLGHGEIPVWQAGFLGVEMQGILSLRSLARVEAEQSPVAGVDRQVLLTQVVRQVDAVRDAG